MVANIRGYTPNYGFKLINFDTPRWHTLEYSNWNMVDAMFLQGGTPQIRGAWQNNTDYIPGDRTFDEETSATYRCLVGHTSVEVGTFAADRTAHPDYWSLQLAGTPVYRGQWLPAVTYVLGDIVYVTEYDYYLCTQANVSSGTFAADAMKWQTIFDATQVVTDAEAAKLAAETAKTAAETAAGTAEDYADSALDSSEIAESHANDAQAAQSAFRWSFNSTTVVGNPTIGRVAFNNGTPNLITEISISAQSADTSNPDVSSWITTWDDSTNPTTRGTVQVRKVGSPEQFMIFELTGAVADSGTWLKLTVTYVSHFGTILDTDLVSVGFVRAGNVGPTGTGGGDMLKANNLNELTPTKDTARANIGLGPLQIPSFSQILLGNEASDDMHAATRGYVDSSPSLYIDTVAPAGVNPGSLWWDSDRGMLFVYYNDGTSSQWVQAVAIPGMDTSGLVHRVGDTMLGPLTLSGDPVDPLHAVTKQYVDVIAPMRGHIHGLTIGYVNTTVLWVNVGEAASDNAAPSLMKLSAYQHKQYNVAWAAGHGQGAWDGSNGGTPLPDGWMHIFVIKKSSTGEVDVLMSAEPNNPIMPTDYDHKRRIGSWFIAGSAVDYITQHGDWFYSPQRTIYSYAGGTGAMYLSLYVPTGIRCIPIMSASFQASSSPIGTDNMVLEMWPGDDLGIQNGSMVYATNITLDRPVYKIIAPVSDLSSRIIFRVNVYSGSIINGALFCNGWIDDRGRTI